MHKKIALAIFVSACIVIYFLFDIGQYASFDFIQEKRYIFSDYYNNNKLFVVIIFFVVYLLVTALAIPSATILTLLAGSIFGFWAGFIIVSFASSIGATITFLMSRFMLFEYFSSKYHKKSVAINESIEKEGHFYLLTLRLVPLVPFFMVNIVMGLTSIKTRIFYIVSQIGMLPATMIYVFTGTKLSQIDSLNDVLSVDIIIALVLLGIFPLIAKKVISIFKSRGVYKKYNRPKKFDYNLIVIGGGAAGLVSSYIASSVKAKVLLIEENKTGGDCLNTGCVPSKALINSAKVINYIKNCRKYGIKKANLKFDFADVIANVKSKIVKIEPHDSFERYKKLGVHCIKGKAQIIDPFSVKINDKVFTSPKMIIATGASPFIPKFKNIDQVNYLTSDTVWNLKDLPKKLVIIGGGAIGCELGQAFARMGSNVTIIESQNNIVSKEDSEIIHYLSKSFKKDGVNIKTEHEVIGFEKNRRQQYVVCKHGNKDVNIEFDQVLISLGRKPNISNFGLEDLKIINNKQSQITTNKFLQTNFPNIYACGDVQTPYQFTNVASHEAWYACINALFSSFKKFAISYSHIPYAIFTDPQVARLGINEKFAKKNNIEFEITTFDLSDLDRAIIDGNDQGFIKVMTKPKSDRILGVTIIGENSAEIIAEFVLAMKNNIGLKKILGTSHIYPSYAETNKYVAGNWQKNNQPRKIMKALEWYHKRVIK